MHYSRRKFIATAASGVAATAVTPMALAAKQPGAYHASSTMESNTRVAPSEFIIFPWGSMPIAPANGPWGDLADTNDMLKDLFDCGFNTSGFTRNIEILRDIRNNQLVGILRVGINTNQEVTQEEADNHIRKVIESITDPEDRKAIHAIYIRDEPNASLFPRLNIWSEAIKKQGFLPYINLYPDAVLPEWLGTKDYEEHLDQYVEICDPPYISYDNYSLFEGGRLDEDRFYGNIEAIRHKSLQAGIPFWNVILANALLHLLHTPGWQLPSLTDRPFRLPDENVGDDAEHKPASALACPSLLPAKEHQRIPYRPHR